MKAIIKRKPIILTSQFWKNFFICGIAGWSVECFWTGLGSIFEGKSRYLFCRTSIWMFPIYGLAAFIEPLCTIMKKRSKLTRGLVYAALIYIVEFVTGTILNLFNACPWDYSKAKLNFRGVIRLDYAPMWILLGLLFEHLLCKSSGSCNDTPQGSNSGCSKNKV